MAGNVNEEKAKSCLDCFDYFPHELYQLALETLNKQFRVNRAGHIKAMESGRGNQLQANNKYEQTKKIAVHEAGHVMTAWYGGSKCSVPDASIEAHWMHYHEPQGHITPLRNCPMQSLSEFFEDLCFWLSGRIAESMFFPKDQPHFPYFLNFPGSDIHKAVNLAYYMTKIEYGIKEDSIMMSQDFLDDISSYLIRAYEATTNLLISKTHILLELAIKLLEVKSIPTEIILIALGPPKKRWISLYDQYCAFSMELRPLARKKYCLSKPKRSKKAKKRKAKFSSKTKKTLAKSSKKNRGRSKKNKVEEHSKTSRKRKLTTNSSNASKKRITNSGDVISVN